MKTICTLRTMLARGLEHGADKPAIIAEERQYTFRELADRTRRMGNALLDLGLGKGDRVAILSRNSIENAESYFSIPNAGLVLVMLNFRLAPAEILTILTDSQASVLMVSEEYADHVLQIKSSLGFVKYFISIGANAETPAGWFHYESLIEAASPREPEGEICDDDLAALMYTSGTTGIPKGCMVMHRNFYHVGKSMALELRMNRNDSGIIPAPLFHVSGAVVLLNAMYSGTTSIIMPCWDVEGFMGLVQKYTITTGMLATPMLLFFVGHPKSDQYELGSLKKIMFAGAPVTSVVFKKAIERFGNIFIHAFGTTETVGSASILRTDEVAQALAVGRTEIFDSCGTSYTDMQTEVVKENGNPVSPGGIGEIRVRGLGTTIGYWNKPHETRKSFRDGWYYTEDLGRVDERGFMYVVGRKKDMIITGGENVFPAEVENILYRHPLVVQAAVIGLQDEVWGESVTAFVVKKAGTQISENEIRLFCRKEIAGYKVPQKVFFVDSLPTSSSGKLLKSRLKELVSAQLPMD
jgi:acyl-CoA synthetase (AMP-forming)/AMP-acid ligase II